MPAPDRWWTDVAKSKDYLDIVGGDDVAQSVGTVALGYHALLAEDLKPLATATLVDHEDVLQALEHTDLVPVAKAMAAAVRPVLGSASEIYAADLVTQMHEESMDSLRHELTVLTQKGVPWPQAIERVTCVAGVPVRAVNGFVQKMAGPTINPRVLADEGDRTLMMWASRLGAREATNPLEPVAKVGQGQEFDPDEHPRGPGGRFVPDQQEPEAAQDPRKARLTRLARLQGLSNRKDAADRKNAVQQEQVAARQRAEEKSLADLQAEVLGRPREGRTRQGRPREGRAREGRTREGRARAEAEYRVTKPAVEQGAEQSRALERRARHFHQLQHQTTIDMSGYQIAVNEINDVISGQELANLGEIEVEAEEQPAGATRFLIDNAYVTHDNGDGTYTLDPNYDYRVVNAGLSPGGYGLQLRLEPTKVAKAADFEEDEHPRDDSGRFAQAPSRRERLTRLARLQGLADRQAAQDAAHEQRIKAAQERQAVEQAAAAALARPREQRAREGRPREGRAREGRAREGRVLDARLRPTGQKKEEPLTGTAWSGSKDILAKHKTAMLVSDYTLSQLTGHYAGDDGLDKPFKLKNLGDRSPTQLQQMMSSTKLVKPSEVGDHLAKFAMNAIGSTASADEMVELTGFDPTTDKYLNFSTAADALSEARQLMLGKDLYDGDSVWVPGVKIGPAGRFQPVARRQHLKPEDVPDAPQHVITGSDDAVIRLANGQTHGLELVRVDQGLDQEQLEKLGGGEGWKRMTVEPYVNAAVFEVVDTRQGPNRRA